MMGEKKQIQLKGLSKYLQEGEEPQIAVPAIWDNGQEEHSKACDVVVTNQRLLGFSYVTFPRERLFLDSLNLDAITAVSLRQKTYEPLFRELLVSTATRKVYIRTSRQKIEQLYKALRSAIERYAPGVQQAFADSEIEGEPASSSLAPVYGRQEIRNPFERSPLAITMLFIGGLGLEVFGAILWSVTHSPSVGFPPFLAGLLAFFTAFLLRRQRR